MKVLRQLALVILAVCVAASAEDLSQQAKILRDSYGVPHIFAESDEAMAFALGYAQAEDHFPALMRLYREVRGEAAAVWGVEEYRNDREAHMLELIDHADKTLEADDTAMRGICESFAQGINFYMNRHSSDVEPWMQPVDARDVVALTERFFLSFSISIVRRRWGELYGSNAWIVGLKRSASGRAMMVSDPHLAWKPFTTWYEAHVKGPGYDAYGAFSLGKIPGLLIGHNGHIAWGSTMNQPILVDLYEIVLDPADTMCYRYDGQWWPVRKIDVEIAVKTDGGIKTRPETFYYTHHGPIIKRHGDKAIAMRIERDAPTTPTKQFMAMAKAQDVADFKKALAMQLIPRVNIVCADRDGNLFYVYNARCPRRPDGYRWSKPLAGDMSKTEWQGILPFNELPQLDNPECGFIQNCNNMPWLNVTDAPFGPDDFARYLCPSPETIPRGRCKRALELLQSKEKLTFEDMQKFACDVSCGHLRNAAQEVLAFCEPYKNDSGLGEIVDECEAAAKAFTGTASADDRAVAFLLGVATGMRRLQERATEQNLTDLIKRCTDRLKNAFGTVAVPLGQAQRHVRGDKDYPLPGTIGCLRSISSRWDGRRLVGTGGSSFNIIVELSDPPRVLTVMPYGQSSRPESAHYADQAELFATLRYKPAWYVESDIRAHLEREYHPGE